MTFFTVFKGYEVPTPAIGYPGPITSNPKLRKLEPPKRESVKQLLRKRREKRDDETFILFFTEVINDGED